MFNWTSYEGETLFLMVASFEKRAKLVSRSQNEFLILDKLKYM